MKTEYEILITPGEINIAPETEIEEIMQNIITICSTAKYSVPMDREFGVDGDFVDETTLTARAKFNASIVNAVRRFEPRARVTQIHWEADSEGTVRPRVYFRLKE